MKLYEERGIPLEKIHTIYLKYKNYTDTVEHLKKEFGLYIYPKTLGIWFRERRLKTFRRISNKESVYRFCMNEKNIAKINIIKDDGRNKILVISIKGDRFFVRSAYRYGKTKGLKDIESYYYRPNFIKRFGLDLEIKEEKIKRFPQIWEELQKGRCSIKRRMNHNFKVICPSGEWTYNGLVLRLKNQGKDVKLASLKYLKGLGNKVIN